MWCLYILPARSHYHSLTVSLPTLAAAHCGFQLSSLSLMASSVGASRSGHRGRGSSRRGSTVLAAALREGKVDLEAAMRPLMMRQRHHLTPSSSGDAWLLLSQADVEEVIHEVVVQHLRRIYQQKPIWRRKCPIGRRKWPIWRWWRICRWCLIWRRRTRWMSTKEKQEEMIASQRAGSISAHLAEACTSSPAG